MFNEAQFEKMMVDVISANGWKYIPAEDLPRTYSDVMVEPMVRDALIRLNPEIAEEPARADEVIYKLRTVILSVQAHTSAIRPARSSSSLLLQSCLQALTRQYYRSCIWTSL